jgi:hypothetical protein
MANTPSILVEPPNTQLIASYNLSQRAKTRPLGSEDDK